MPRLPGSCTSSNARQRERLITEASIASSGSACSSNHPGISGTLKGIGVKKELLDSTIRFSLGDLNTEEEVDYAIGVLGELLPVLRKYTRH